MSTFKPVYALFHNNGATAKYLQGVYHQKGNGVGSVLSGLFRLLTPFIKRGAKAALRSQPVRRALQSAKKSAIKTATVAASDLIAGKNIKQNAQLNLKQAQRNIEKAITGPPPVKKKKRPPPSSQFKKRIIAAPGVVPQSKKTKPLI